jgi:putative membrane protein insertion efficiency factor
MLQVYKRLFSPMLPAACRYVPTCSEYAEEAIERYGVVRGGLLAARRLSRCHPLAGAGYDPVPDCDKFFSERGPAPSSILRPTER